MFKNNPLLESIVSGRHYLIATDGSCLENPGVGGWAFVKQLKEGDQVLRQAPTAGRYDQSKTTNNRMEMTAVIKALKSIVETDTPLVILSDCQLVIKGMTEWVAGWKARGWTKAKGALENVDLWQYMDELAQGKKISWVWVKGHADNVLNNQADMLARNAAAGRYPNSKKSIREQCPFLFVDQPVSA